MSNLRMWRANDDLIAGKKFFDGKWRWILYDVDMSLGLQAPKDHNTLEHAISSSVPNTFIFQKVFQSPIFRERLLNRAADILNTHYKSSRTVEVLNRWKSLIQPELDEHYQRWKAPNYWDYHLGIIQTFLTDRPYIYKNHLKSHFSVNGTYQLTITNPDTTRGTVQVNRIVIHPETPGVPLNFASWTGEYFNNIPLQTKPIARQGYTFSHWMVNNTMVSDSILTLNRSSNISYSVHFKEQEIIIPQIPEAITLLQERCTYKLYEWSAELVAGSKPQGAEFVYFKDADPKVYSPIEGFTSGAFNHTSGTRINGKNEQGISFINTGGGSNPTYLGSKMGGLVLALKTEGLDSVKISWTGRTFAINNQPYAIRLQYRDTHFETPNSMVSNFQDFHPIVNYDRGNAVGHSKRFTVYLPQNMLNKPYVQLLWRYYRSETLPSATGSRDELGIDDIEIYGVRNLNQHTSNENVQNAAYISSQAKIQQHKIDYQAGSAILLKPGFEVKPGAVFKANINTCK